MNKAYIIVDMSNDFVHGEGSLTAGSPAQNAVGPILKRLEQFNNNNELIVFAMDSHEPDDDHFLLWTPHNVKGTWGAELYGELNSWYQDHKEKDNVLFLGKSEYDAFYNTNLSEILKEQDVDTVYIAGVCTDICVFHTTYGAYKAGFKTIVNQNECATFTDNHEIFLKQMELIYKTKIV